MKNITSPIALLAAGLAMSNFAAEPTHPVVGTGQNQCYDNSHPIAAPQPGRPFYGQDAQHPGNTPACRDNGDGTVPDLVTGLMWVQERGAKVTWDDAMADAQACRAGGHDDGRVPTIKELYRSSILPANAAGRWPVQNHFSTRIIFISSMATLRAANG